VTLISALSTVTTTTVPVFHDVVVRGDGGPSVLVIVGTVAAVIAALGTLWLVYALRHDRSYATFGKPFVRQVTSTSTTVAVHVDVLQGSSPWKVRSYEPRFWVSGRELAPSQITRLNDFPMHGHDRWTSELAYELATIASPIEVAIKVRFRGGGRYEMKKQRAQ
jgi:hypothetical protein